MEGGILAYNALDFGEGFEYFFEGLGAVVFGWGYYDGGGCGCGGGYRGVFRG